MIKMTKETETVLYIKSIICDVCGQEFDEDFDIQEFVHIRHYCGYSSSFGDGQQLELDMCQYCLSDRLGKYIRYKKESEEL